MGGQVEKTRAPARNLGMSKQARRNIQERREIGESGKDWQEKDRLPAFGYEAKGRRGNRTVTQVLGLGFKVYLS